MNPVAVPVPGHLNQTAVFIRLAGDSLETHGNPKTGMFTAGAVIAVQFVDTAGRVARALAEVIPFRGLMADARSTTAKPIESTQVLDLAPGAYQVQVAVYDQIGERASVVKVPYDVREPTPPVVGSLMIVDHAERLPADQAQDASNPFIVGGVLLHPAYDAGVNRMVQRALNFILPVVVAPGAEAPGATLSLLQNGQSIASVPLPLGTADATGKYMAVGRVPLDKVPAGTYELQITVGTGPGASVRKTPLTVVG